MQTTQSKPEVFVFDIDGTLANHNGVRGPYEEHKVLLDKPITPVIKVLKSLFQHYKIIFLSGRTDACKTDTLTWLRNELESTGVDGIGYKDFEIDIFMRKQGDKRKDSVVKKEIYDNEILPNYSVIGVFDDRLQVCRMLYEEGLFCFNVNQGLKEF